MNLCVSTDYKVPAPEPSGSNVDELPIEQRVAEATDSDEPLFDDDDDENQFGFAGGWGRQRTGQYNRKADGNDTAESSSDDSTDDYSDSPAVKDSDDEDFVVSKLPFFVQCIVSICCCAAAEKQLH